MVHTNGTIIRFCNLSFSKQIGKFAADYYDKNICSEKVGIHQIKLPINAVKGMDL